MNMNDENLQNPFVIQCNNCNAIIADSFSLLDYKDDKYFFTNINIGDLGEKKTSTNEYDNECTYQIARCSCSFVVGKKYLTVNENLGGLAGKYSVDVNKVSCYGLGNAVSDNITMTEIIHEIRRLQRMCVYLYRRQDNESNKP